MADATKPPAYARCPICKRPTTTEFRPFCSKRCADVDLSRWLTGSYAIASGGADADEDGDDAAPLHGDTGGTRKPN
jgi:uncharacterized protein